ncbi:MAG: hypothetical protein K2O73_01720, partial [Lachnospiraceae bacterium]|nr:hypothetical protein [Lachnospiraceae bacterium]
GYIEGTDIIGGNISGTNITGTNISGTNISGTNISGGTISGAVMNNGNGTFSVDQNGKMTANSASIDGTITTSNLTAKGGTIGGASISPLGISFNSGDTGWGLWGTTDHAGIVFHAGGNTAHIGSAPFRVYHDGSFVATNANIEGTIKASDGSFQGTINATSGTFENVIIKESCTVAGQSITGTIGGSVNWKGNAIGDTYLSGISGSKVGKGIDAGNVSEGTLSRPIQYDEETKIGPDGITAKRTTNSLGNVVVSSLRPAQPNVGGGLGTDIGGEGSSNQFRRIYSASFIGSLQESSSRELKTNISDVNALKCLETVLNTDVKTYNYKSDLNLIKCDSAVKKLEKEKEDYISSLSLSPTPEQLENIKSYEYRIEAEKSQNASIPQKRFGFISEDAPEEIVSKDRKTVDLYSCVAMAYGAIQALNEKVNNLIDKKGE